MTGDFYAAGWTETAWKSQHLRYERSAKNKSVLYVEALPTFTRGLVRMPEHARLLRELRLLERSTTRAGQDKVDHPPRANDDYANAVCGLLAKLGGKPAYDVTYAGWDDAPLPAQYEQPTTSRRPLPWGGMGFISRG